MSKGGGMDVFEETSIQLKSDRLYNEMTEIRLQNNNLLWKKKCIDQSQIGLLQIGKIIWIEKWIEKINMKIKGKRVFAIDDLEDVSKRSEIE